MTCAEKDLQLLREQYFIPDEMEREFLEALEEVCHLREQGINRAAKVDWLLEKVEKKGY